MNESPSKAFSTFTAFFGDGPWRSKSVLAALAAVVVGLGSWVADLRKDPTQNETKSAPASVPAIASPNATAGAPAPTSGQADGRKSVPPYVPFCASYAAAYCIGWLFRKLMRLIAVTSAVVVALLAYGKFAGWDLTRTREQVQRGSEWARHETAETRDYLLHLLPSAVGGGAGVFLGFRRRSKATPTNRSPA